jgi:hypothetical protein
VEEQQRSPQLPIVDSVCPPLGIVRRGCWFKERRTKQEVRQGRSQKTLLYLYMHVIWYNGYVF